jgi:cell wall-associated NlpC family hydrolase
MKKKILFSTILSLGILASGMSSVFAATTTYTTNYQDTFQTISQKFSVSVSDLVAANPNIDPTNVYGGLVFQIPNQSTNSSSESYTIQSGDTFWLISQKLNVSLSSLIAANPSVDPNNLLVGTAIHVPSATSSPSNWEVQADNIIKTAMGQMGTPYVFGGETPNVSFDCSGFTSYCFGKNGISLPHNAFLQSQLGTPVSKDQLRKGDLLFFQNTYKTGVDHVGIYIGNGQMIHADVYPANGVQIQNINSTYFTQHYWGAKRLIQG